jgi:hypothetical protein
MVKAYFLLMHVLPKEITGLMPFVVPGNAASVRSEPATPRTQTTLQQRHSPNGVESFFLEKYTGFLVSMQ